MLYFRGKVVSTKDLFVAATKAASKELQIDSTKLQVQTQSMNQSIAIMSLQFNYGKISFIVLVPVQRPILAQILLAKVNQSSNV